MTSTSFALGLTILTLAVVTALGVWYSRSRVRTVEDLISARNRSGRGSTAATIIASMMGAWILFSPAEAGAAFGGLAAIAGYAIGSAIPMVLFVYVGARVRRLIPAGHTLTEYVYVRYGRIMYTYVLCITVFYMFVFLAAEMTGITGAMALVAGVPPWQTAILVGGFVLIYTTYGGLVASIFTDTVQVVVILPLISISFAAALLSLGGAGEVYAAVTATNSSLLDPGYRSGLTFGAYVTIAVVAANMFNQGLWQRIFAARDTSTVRRSFGIAAVGLVPMVLLPGLFGIAAAGLGLVGGSGDASIAFFLLLDETFPPAVVLGIVILVVLLVMSTADTMFSAIASIATADVPLIIEEPSRRTLLFAARGLTVLVGACAIYVGAQGYSVLELFLLADLLAAATVFPFLFGLYSSRASQSAVLVASVTALAVGLAYFPISRNVLAAILPVGGSLPNPSFLYAFAGSAGVSIVVTVLLSRLADARFDHATLEQRIRTLDHPSTDGGSVVSSYDPSDPAREDSR